MSLRDLSAGSVGRCRLRFYRPRVEVLEYRTLLSFITAPTYAVGLGPESVAVGDFNRDGILDLAVANAGTPSHLDSNSVSVLLGNGDGTFHAAQSYAIGSPVFVAVGDFNSDGILDLAVAVKNWYTGQGTVSILLGNGDGTFQATRSYGAWTASLAVADFDGDGKLDLVTSGGSLFLGGGDGTFQAAQNYGASGENVAVGDFNRDGIADLALANGGGPGTVSILLGRGDGSFRAPQSHAASDYPVSVAVGDFNSDGIDDLAVADSYGLGTVSVLLGNGDGTFQAAQNYTVGSVPYSAAVGDFNGDSHLDLAVANYGSDTVGVLLGKGDGTFQVSPVSYAVGSYPYSVTVGDFNRDGHLDLAVANSAIYGGAPSASILLGRGDGTFPAAPVCYAVGLGPDSVAIGDFNGDGFSDLAVANAGAYPDFAGTVSSLLGRGDGTFQAAQTYVVGSNPQSVVVADINGDGIPDLVVANHNSNTVSVLLGNSDGTFRAAQNYAVGVGPTSVAVGDFNGDGIPDLAVADGGIFPTLGNTLSVLPGNGDGTFRATQSYAVGLVPESVALGDFNGDGISDLAVVNGGTIYNYGSTVSILLGNGDGSFQLARALAAGTGPNSVAVGDFNGDGKEDIVTTNFAQVYDPRHPGQIIESDVRVFLGNGDGTFQAAQTYAAGSRPQAVVVGDFNGDGFPDLAVANTFYYLGSSSVSVLLGKGDGSFQAALSYAAGGSPFSLAVGDFNGDRFLDLAVANNFTAGIITVLINAADWGGGNGAVPAGRPALHPTAHRLPPLKPVFARVAASQPQALWLPLLTSTDVPPNPVQQWPVQMETGQAAYAELTFTPQLLFTARRAQDAMFERWGGELLDVLTMDWLR